MGVDDGPVGTLLGCAVMVGNSEGSTVGSSVGGGAYMIFAPVGNTPLGNT